MKTFRFYKIYIGTISGEVTSGAVCRKPNLFLDYPGPVEFRKMGPALFLDYPGPVEFGKLSVFIWWMARLMVEFQKIRCIYLVGGKTAIL